ncbi:hypothetical protein GPECTOR_11g269 [Gonium pectorale]|uniref:Uncharacterized protein n=1 Tax=Gonium pectorale TaxID=33097 RepID=A0A150GPS3_GONPE|nr:hypothetical protein GPECTOR_11g269 [Gonium pectorale]|eukprot:KXZ51829.1 hypothetical protein GPECTOR_11g269 [Gonium pectorale]
MELGNKWTSISHFLPARSDNDVKNIWHSTLRSKNSERRSFLRTYARAVRDCANDTDARRQAYDMAQRVCGPPQPIEIALAIVQQQYQQSMMLQDGPDEVLETAPSPEHAPGFEGDAELGATAAKADGLEPSPLLPGMQGLPDQLLENRRSGASSRTTASAAHDSQQHSGCGTKGHGSPTQSPLPRKSFRVGASTPSPSPNPLEAAVNAATFAAAFGGAGGQGFQLLDGRDGRGSRSQSHHQHQHLLTVDDVASLAPSSRASDFDSACIARFSGLQLADQLQRQQQQQQQHNHHQQFQQHHNPYQHHSSQGGGGSGNDLLHPGRPRNTSSSGPQGRVQPLSQAMLNMAYGSVGTVSASLQTASGSNPGNPVGGGIGMHRSLMVPGMGMGMATDHGGGSSAAGCPADIDDLVALGLDLTPEELRLLAQGEGAPPGLGGGGGGGSGILRIGESPQADTVTAERALGLARSIHQQQQHQFVVSAHPTSGGGGTNSSLLQTGAMPLQQSGYSSLELPSSPLQTGPTGGRPQSGPSSRHFGDAQQARNPIDSILLTDLEQAPRGQMAFHQAHAHQQHPNHGSGGGYTRIPSSAGAAGGPERGHGGYQGGLHPGALTSSRLGQHGAGNCSSTFDQLTSGQQHLRQQGGPSVLGHMLVSQSSLPNNSNSGHNHNNGGVASPLGHGSSKFYQNRSGSGVVGSGGLQLPGSRPWGPGLLRGGAAASTNRTLSSPAPFCCDVSQLQRHQGSLGGAAGGGLGFAGMPSGGAAGGGSSRLGSMVAQHMASLAEPTTVDVVTMGLDSGNLLDCMDCEGTPLEPDGGPADAGKERAGLPDPFELTLRQPHLRSSAQHPQFDLMAPGAHGGHGGGNGLWSGGHGQGQGQQQHPCSPATWPASLPPTGTSRIGPMLQL